MADVESLRKDVLPLDVWAEEALCLEMPSSVFESVDTIGTALAACSHCPVQRECLTWALDTEQTTGTWGNKTARQRRYLTAEDVQYWPPALMPSIVITAGSVPGGPARVESGIMARAARPPADAAVAVPNVVLAAPVDQSRVAGSGKPERKPPADCDNRCYETGTNASVRHYLRGESACRQSLDAASRYRKQQRAKKAAAEQVVASPATVTPAPAPDPIPAPDQLKPEKPKVRVCWLVPSESTPPGISYEYSYRSDEDDADIVISARIAEIRASQGKQIRRRTVYVWQDVGGGEL